MMNAHAQKMKITAPTGLCGLEWNETTHKKIYSDNGNNTSYYHTGNGLVVIDIDALTLPKELQPIMGSLKPTTKTKRGSHYYFTHSQDIKYTNPTHLGRDKNIDIRSEGGKIFFEYRGDSEHISYIHKPKNIYNLDNYPMVKHWLDNIAIKKHIPKENHENTELTLVEVAKHLDNIDILQYQDRDRWMAILASAYAANSGSEELAREWSKRDPEGYDEASFNHIWNQLESGSYGEVYSAGTLIRASMGEKPNPLELFKEEEGEVKPISKKKKKRLLTDFDYYIRKKVLLEIDDIQRTPLTKIIFNQSLHMFHGLSGVGKSYCVVTELEQVDKTHKYYIDVELNGGDLQKRCEENGVQYIPTTAGIEMIDHMNNSKFDLSDTIIVIDSFNNFVPNNLSQKDSDDVASLVKKMRKVCIQTGATIIIIDHSTTLSRDDDGNPDPKKVKIEGNATGKEKNLDFCYKIVPNDIADQTKGVYVVCEKTRAPEFIKKYQELQLQDSFFKDESNKTYTNTQLKMKKQQQWYEKNFDKVEMIKQVITTLRARPNTAANLNLIGRESGLPHNQLQLLLNMMRFYDIVELGSIKINGRKIPSYKINKDWSPTSLTANAIKINPKGRI